MSQKVFHAMKSKVIVLMIPNGEGCAAKSKRTHYLAIKKLSILS